MQAWMAELYLYSHKKPEWSRRANILSKTLLFVCTKHYNMHVCINIQKIASVHSCENTVRYHGDRRLYKNPRR